MHPQFQVLVSRMSPEILFYEATERLVSSTSRHAVSNRRRPRSAYPRPSRAFVAKMIVLQSRLFDAP
jgi:hypothetical protein